ncbi:MAG: protease complex subunit PrcB family protein [Lachnospiraceae bacterium]|nr:protease complex subunit PrcB family protein [Lachnospiraceae bacterium]
MKIFLSGAKEKKYRRRGVLCGILAAWVLLAGGCTFLSQEKIKLRDLDFTVLSEEKIPEQLSAIIEEKKESAFQITYTDNANLYICIGYGKQETGGYSIAVDELYLTDTNICVSTTLLGPEASEKSNKTPSHPYIVIKTEFLEQTVTFE